MSSLGGVALLAGGLVVVVLAAELFLDGVLAAASTLRLSAYALTVLLSGLELENLAAGVAAALAGLPDAAAGTFLGGATFLALGVTGIAALVRPLEARVTARLAVPALIAPAATLALGVDGSLTRLDGVLILVVFAVATVGLIVGAPAAPPDPAPRSARAAFARLGAGLAGLTIGGALLGEGLTRSVDGLGLSEALLGNTVVAASVEAEEVVRVVTPARRGRGDLGLANVLGTIVHFAALNAGVIALVRPLELSSDTVRYFLPAPLAATAILLGLLAWRGALSRLAGIGLLALYGAYVAAAVAIGLG